MLDWLEKAFPGLRRSAAPDARSGPERMDQWVREGFAFHTAGSLPAAEEMYRRILREQPDHPDALYLLGDIMLQAGNSRLAIELIGKAVALSGGVAAFHYALGLALQAEGRLEEATASYRKALQLDPDCLEYHYVLAGALQAQERFDDAHAVLQAYLRLKIKRDSGGDAKGIANLDAGRRTRINDTTLCCVDCRNYDLAIHALNRTREKCDFERVLFLTDKDFDLPGIEVARIDAIRSIHEYSRFMIKELYRHIDTEFVLSIQYDGYVLNGSKWDERFQHYDYVGAKWAFDDGLNVGNGGFSLRSRRLLQALTDDRISELVPEDTAICRTYRRFLEQQYQIRFAPEDVAERFSFESVAPKGGTFGFHGIGHMVRIMDMTERELEQYRPGPIRVYRKNA